MEKEQTTTTPEKTPEQLFAEENATDATGEHIPVVSPEPTKKPDTTSKPVYDRDAILRKKEMARLSAEKRALEARVAEVERFRKQLDTARAKLADPATPYAERVRLARDTIGLDVDTLAESFIKDGDPAPDKTAFELKKFEGELKALRDEQEKKAAEEARRLAAQQERVYLDNARDFITKNEEKYPILHALDKSAALVHEVDRLSSAGELDPTITLDDIASELEERVTAEIEKELKTLLGKEKFKELLARVNAPGEKSANKLLTKKHTLNNKMSTAPREDFDYSKATPADIERYAREALNEFKNG